MKKRIVCVLLTLIMLVSLVPATALTASAATYRTSEAAITVLKQMEGYSKYCSPEGYTGYGTLCKHTGEHGMGNHPTTEKQADVALREDLQKLDAVINQFAASNGLALNQSKHDALVLFSFENGTAWTTGTGAFKQAVVKRLVSHDFLNAICNFKSTTADDYRRMVEANMYLNGVYSSARPSSFIRVYFEPGTLDVYDYDLDVYESYDAELSANHTQYYDTSVAPAPHLVPTVQNGIFLGWYLEDTYENEDGDSNTDMILVTTLKPEHHDVTLHAGWQYFGANPDESDDLHDAHYIMNSTQLADTYIYASPYDITPMTELNANGKEKKLVISGYFTVDKEFVDGTNTKWGHVITGEYKLKGENKKTYTFSYEDDYVDRWVKLGTLSAGGNTADLPDIDVTVTVTNTYVNRRSSASIYSGKNGSYNYGDQLRIIGREKHDGFWWGKVAKSANDNTCVGWVALMYTNYDSVKDQTNVNTSTVIATATVNYNGYVNVRSDAGTDSSIVGALGNGTQVNIYEIKYVNGHQWGRCNTGWICLSYAVVSNLSDKLNYNNDIGFTSYVFSGTLVSSDVQVYTQPAETAELISPWIRVKPDVTVSNLINVEGITWGKIAEGWVKVSDEYGNPIDVELDIAKFTVCADNVTVRENPSTDAARVNTLSINTEFNVNDSYQVIVIGDTIWGYADKVGEDDPTYIGWVNLANKYVTRNGVTGGNTGTGSTNEPTVTGLGMVSGTYTGVNVRQTPGVNGALLDKIPAGSTINIYETKTHGAAQWGRTDKGWVCMDYVTMIGDLPADVLAGLTGNTGSNGGTTTSSESVVFTGKAAMDGVVIYKTTSRDSDPVRTLNAGDPVTIHELLSVKETIVVNNENTNENSTTTTQEIYSKWARVNDGYIYSPGDCLDLDTLDEVVYTVTESETLNVRDNPGTSGTNVLFKLHKGDQVIVTRLQIVDGKIWAYVECEGVDEGWASLSYMTRGAIDVNANTGNTGNAGNTGNTGNVGNTGNTGNAGNTNNNDPIYSTGNTGAGTGGAYLYTGKIINTDSVNVRAFASTSASLSTTLKRGTSIVIYETVISESMAWGRCDAGWVYLYYVDLTPVGTAVDARVVYNEGTEIYSGAGSGTVVGSYSKMSVIDIYEIVGKWARTDLGWVHTDNLL